MSVPPPPPRRKKHSSHPVRNGDISNSGNGISTAGGSGFNAARHAWALNANGEPESVDIDEGNSITEKYDHIVPKRLRDTLITEPETSVGKGVSARGRLNFDRLLYIYGTFTGTLNSKGSLVIKEGGMLRGELINANMVVIEGKVVGKITCDEIWIVKGGQFFGDITCRSIVVDPDCILVGPVNVHPGVSNDYLIAKDALEAELTQYNADLRDASILVESLTGSALPPKNVVPPSNIPMHGLSPIKTSSDINNNNNNDEDNNNNDKENNNNQSLKAESEPEAVKKAEVVTGTEEKTEIAAAPTDTPVEAAIEASKDEPTTATEGEVPSTTTETTPDTETTSGTETEASKEEEPKAKEETTSDAPKEEVPAAEATTEAATEGEAPAAEATTEAATEGEAPPQKTEDEDGDGKLEPLNAGGDVGDDSQTTPAYEVDSKVKLTGSDLVVTITKRSISSDKITWKYLVAFENEDGPQEKWIKEKGLEPVT